MWAGLNEWSAGKLLLEDSWQNGVSTGAEAKNTQGGSEVKLTLTSAQGGSGHDAQCRHYRFNEICVSVNMQAHTCRDNSLVTTFTPCATGRPLSQAFICFATDDTGCLPNMKQAL